MLPAQLIRKSSAPGELVATSDHHFLIASNLGSEPTIPTGSGTQPPPNESVAPALLPDYHPVSSIHEAIE